MADNNKPKIIAIPDANGKPAFAMGHSDGVKVKGKGTLTKELTAIRGGLDKAFSNWESEEEEVPVSGDEILYERQITSNLTLLQSNYPIVEGEHIRFTFEGGSGTYTVYMYAHVSQNQGKTLLGSITNKGVIDIPSFYYPSGYDYWVRILITVPSAVNLKFERLAPDSGGDDEDEPAGISLSSAIKKEVNDMIDEKLEDFTPSEGGSGTVDSALDTTSENPLQNKVITNEFSAIRSQYGSLIGKTILNGITNRTELMRDNAAFSDLSIGDYLKIVVGDGTTGSWDFIFYVAYTSPKTTITYSQAGTYYFKIQGEFNRLTFIPASGTDKPLSVSFVSAFEKDLLNTKETIKIDQNLYYNKGQSNNIYSKLPCIVVAGQSNADGRVLASELPEYITLPNSNVHVFGGSTFSALSTGYYANNKSLEKCFGFDLVMLHYLSQVKECYVVKHAVGGTSLSPNGNTGWTADYEGLTNSLLKTLENKIRGAVNISTAVNPQSAFNFDIRAIVWHQGEADSDVYKALNYYAQLKKLIAYIRGVCGNPTLPFIGGTISHNSGSYSTIVESAMLKIASEDKFVTFIDMSGASVPDGLHFDLTSAEYLGKKVYNALIDYGVISGEKLDAACPWEE